MDKVAKLEFLLMAFIQKLVRLTEVAKSLVTFLISLPFFPSSLYVWYGFIDSSREAGGGEMWGFLVQGEALLTSVVQLAEELAGYVYWRSYVEGSFSYLVFQDHDSFQTFHEFNIAETVLVSIWQYIQTPPVLTGCPAKSCPLFVLMVIFILSFQRFNLWDSASADIFRGLDSGRNKYHLPYWHGGNQQSVG